MERIKRSAPFKHGSKCAKAPTVVPPKEIPAVLSWEEALELAVRDIRAFSPGGEERMRKAPGRDGVYPDVFKAEWSQNKRDSLIKQIKNGYQPSQSKICSVSKPDGRSRKISLPTAQDRVTASATLFRVRDDLEKGFSVFSLGSRPGLSQHHALRLASRYYRDTGIALKIDISSFFDSINHDILMNLVSKKVGLIDEVKLISKFIRVDGKVGIPQGNPLSPCLGNLFLDSIDQSLVSKNISFVRYLDDLIVFPESRQTAESLKKDLDALLNKLKLAMNPLKTRIYSQGNLPFLGFEIMLCGDVVVNLARVQDAALRLVTEVNGRPGFFFSENHGTFCFELIKRWHQLTNWFLRADNQAEVFAELDKLSDKLFSIGLENLDVRSYLIEKLKLKGDLQIANEELANYLGEYSIFAGSSAWFPKRPKKKSCRKTQIENWVQGVLNTRYFNGPLIKA